MTGTTNLPLALVIRDIRTFHAAGEALLSKPTRLIVVPAKAGACAQATECLVSALRVEADEKAAFDRSDHFRQHLDEFVDAAAGRVRDKDDVLVLDRKLLRQQVGFGVPQVEAVDDRRGARRRPSRDRL